MQEQERFFIILIGNLAQLCSEIYDVLRRFEVFRCETLRCFTTKLCAILLPKIVAFGNLANFYLGTWQNFEGLQAAAIFSKTVPSGFAGGHKFRIIA